MSTKEIILKMINCSRILSDYLAEERNALEKNRHRKLSELTVDKNKIITDIGVLQEQLGSVKIEPNSKEHELFQELLVLNEENHNNNLINSSIITGLIKTNKALLTEITGTVTSKVYGTKGIIETTSKHNLAKA